MRIQVTNVEGFLTLHDRVRRDRLHAPQVPAERAHLQWTMVWKHAKLRVAKVILSSTVPTYNSDTTYP